MKKRKTKPSRSNVSQNTTNCRVIAKGVGRVSSIAEINMPPHWNKNILNAHFLMRYKWWFWWWPSQRCSGSWLLVCFRVFWCCQDGWEKEYSRTQNHLPGSFVPLAMFRDGTLTSGFTRPAMAKTRTVSKWMRASFSWFVSECFNVVRMWVIKRLQSYGIMERMQLLPGHSRGQPWLADLLTHRGKV